MFIPNDQSTVPLTSIPSTQLFPIPFLYSQYTFLLMENTVSKVVDSLWENSTRTLSERHLLYEYRFRDYTFICRLIIDEGRKGKQRECYQSILSSFTSYCRNSIRNCKSMIDCVQVYQHYESACKEINGILDCCHSMRCILSKSQFMNIAHSIFIELLLHPNKQILLLSVDYSQMKLYIPMILTMDPNDEKHLVSEYIKEPLSLYFQQRLSQPSFLPVLNEMDEWKSVFPGFNEWKRSLCSTISIAHLQKCLSHQQPFPFSNVISLLPFLASPVQLFALNLLQQQAIPALSSLASTSSTPSSNRNGLQLARLLISLSTVPQIHLDRYLSITGVLETLVLTLHHSLQQLQRPEEEILKALLLYRSKHRLQLERLLMTFFLLRWTANTFSKRVESFCLSTDTMVCLLSDSARATISQLLQASDRPIHSGLLNLYLGQEEYRYAIRANEERTDRRYWIQAELVRDYS